MHILVTGWFSFADMGTTAGDLIAKDIVCHWLTEAGVTYDVAIDEGFNVPDAVNWKNVSSSRYTDLIFVCGPFGNGWPVSEMLDKFSACRITGINLSLLQSLHEWNPFELIYERDHFNRAFPDLTFAGGEKKVPVVGIIRAHKQKEYGKRALHAIANEMIDWLAGSRPMSIVDIDTSIGNNACGLRSPEEIESLIAKMDVVVTTRLHGTVLGIKNGVPVIPIDPIENGAKITLQVMALKWPILLQAGDNWKQETITQAFEYCTTPAAISRAHHCAETARMLVNDRKQQFIDDLLTLEQRQATTATSHS